jgi:hypothetical protein
MSYVLHVIPHDTPWDASLGSSPGSFVACVQGVDRPRVTDWFVRRGQFAEEHELIKSTTTTSTTSTSSSTSSKWDVTMHKLLDDLATRTNPASEASLRIIWHVTASDLPQWQLRHVPDALSVAFFGWMERARTMRDLTSVLYVIPVQQAASRHSEWWPHHACLTAWRAVCPIPFILGPPAHSGHSTVRCATLSVCLFGECQIFASGVLFN